MPPNQTAACNQAQIWQTEPQRSYSVHCNAHGAHYWVHPLLWVISQHSLVAGVFNWLLCIVYALDHSTIGQSTIRPVAIPPYNYSTNRSIDHSTIRQFDSYFHLYYSYSYYSYSYSYSFLFVYVVRHDLKCRATRIIRSVGLP